MDMLSDAVNTVSIVIKRFLVIIGVSISPFNGERVQRLTERGVLCVARSPFGSFKPPIVVGRLVVRLSLRAGFES